MDDNNHSAAESKQSDTKTAHEYIRDILPFKYQEFSLCGTRTNLACIRCGYCYSCHWMKEKEERRILEYKITGIFSSPANVAYRKVLIEKILEQQPSQETRQQRLIIDVHGTTSEPICRYHGRDHKFSAHGAGRCKCEHPSNMQLGVFTKYP
jgi:hypothetical protein